MGKRKKYRTPRHTFGSGGFLRLYWNVLDSVAYRVLTPSQRLVLIDMLREYFGASSFDTDRIPDGFTYTYGQCTVDITDKTFYSAIRRIRKVGFFDRPIEIQEHRPAAPNRYVPSAAWEKYRPSDIERQKLNEFTVRKKKAI